MADAARPVPIEDKIDCVRREVRRRELAHERDVRSGFALPPLAARELETMRAALATLESIRDVVETLRRLTEGS